MKSLFDPAARASVQSRFAQLSPGAVRQWGKMDSAQMMAHCSNALEVGTGDRPRKQAMIGKLLGRFVKTSLLGEKPFSRNSPTDPTFIISDPRDFDAERTRLAGLIERFAAAGPENAGKQTHSFLGRLGGDEWAVMMYKHLDHHLRQFGA